MQLKILYTNSDIFINNLQSICTDKLYLEWSFTISLTA